MEDVKSREMKVLEAAEALFGRGVDWAAFYQQTFGKDGIVRRAYASLPALEEFERTETYARLQRMLARLREAALDDPPKNESTKVITVRIPESLHEELAREANERQTSVNKLCISKLLQVIDSQLVPSSQRLREEARRAAQLREQEATDRGLSRSGEGQQERREAGV